MKVVSADSMRSIEQRVFDSYGLSPRVMMEVAGGQLAEVARRLAADHPGPIVVICGKGNNGGDGLVAARWLHHWGLRVQAVAWFNPEDVQEGSPAAEALLAARLAGVPILMPAQAPGAARKAGMLIDALFGTGWHGSVKGLAAEAIKLMNTCNKPVLAVDLPSGVHPDSGQADGPAVQAAWTATLGLPKLGLFQFPGADLAGEMIVVDIGVPAAAIAVEPISVELTRSAQVAGWLPQYGRNAHKGTRGRVLVAAASRGMTGAAALAGEAALRVGAGLVTVAAPLSSQPVVAGIRPEFMTLPFAESAEGGFAADAAGPFLERAAKMNAIAVGPGIGTDPEAAEFVRRVVAGSTVPLVLDADAIKAFRGRPEQFAHIEAPIVLTPHPGEMAQFLGTTVETVQTDRFGTAREAARRSGAVVLLKGAFTLIAEPSGQVWINPTGSRALGTGGSGDVLTGVIAGLLAQGLAPTEAAVAGAYLHGLAGDRLAAELGDDGILAGDLALELPRAQQAVRQGIPDRWQEFWG
jgi:hydroxyethylthiazole kinase-like uncharacterized protein yjeF